MTDIDAIRERHQQHPDYDPPYCVHCGDADTDWAWQWPCDTRVVLDALDAARDLAGELSRRLDAEITRADAAEADAERLAEALRASALPGSSWCWCGSRDGGHDDECMAIDAALRQHEEMCR